MNKVLAINRLPHPSDDSNVRFERRIPYKHPIFISVSERRTNNEKRLFFALVSFILFVVLLSGGTALAKKYPPAMRNLDPIVSTDWLADNSEKVIILDVRSADAYAEGHIPGAVNEPFVVPLSAWITMRGDLLLEVPDEAALFESIGNLGITRHSKVVIVTAPNPGEPPHYGLSAATRVACTLIYAGVVNVAVLDGGYPQWEAEGRPATTEGTSVTPVAYWGKINQRIFVSIDYVRRNIRRSDILDARDADVYYGETIEAIFTGEVAGHIPGATSLPAPWIWVKDGVNENCYLFKDAVTLAQMARGALRQPWGKKAHYRQNVIVYCGVGGYASSWWFVLTQVLGYENVKFFDGSAQEWALHYNMVPYQWD
jgi:thiosulfate/3-mercaptopyruvate sulfurtransferase